VWESVQQAARSLQPPQPPMFVASDDPCADACVCAVVWRTTRSFGCGYARCPKLQGVSRGNADFFVW
jgi:hypothetical protein